MNNSQTFRKEPVKDPRLRVSPPNSQEAIKWGDKVTSPTSLTSKGGLKPVKKKKGAVSVMNKIMTNLSANKVKHPSNSQEKSKLSVETAKDTPHRERDINEKKLPEKSKRSETIIKTDVPKTGLSTKSIVSSNTNSVCSITTNSATSITTSAVNTSPITSPVDTVMSVKTTPDVAATPPVPFSSAFNGLSSRDMQIAAQAAAIATAMHQMQATSEAPIAPEQSAQLAAQFIKMMQGASMASTALPTTKTSLTSTTAEIAASTKQTDSTTTVASSSSSNVTLVSTGSTTNKPKTTDSSSKMPPKQDVLNNTSKMDNSRKTDSSSKNVDSSKSSSSNKTENKKHSKQVDPHKDKYADDKLKVKNDTNKRDTVRDRSPLRSSIRHEESKAKSKNENIRKTDGNSIRDIEKSRGRERIKTDTEKLEPPSKKLKDTTIDPNERSRKARARSPSRYYCRLEQKMNTDKRVEEKEKEMKLQRIHRNSEGDDQDYGDDSSASDEQIKIYQQFAKHLGELEKRHAKPNSKITLLTLDNVFKQVSDVYYST